MQDRPPTRATGRKQPSEHLGAMRAEHGHSGQRSCAHLARARFAARPTTPASHDVMKACFDATMRAGARRMVDGPGCSWAPRSHRATSCQRVSKVSASRGTSGAGQARLPCGRTEVRGQSALTRVRGAECAQGVVWTLRDGLRGHARATSLLHILTHLYLVDDCRQHGHHGGMSRRSKGIHTSFNLSYWGALRKHI